MLVVVAGCFSPGRLVTWNVQPYSTDFHTTAIGTKRCIIRDHKVKVAVGAYSLQAEWDSDYVRRAAMAAGITNIYYIDQQTISFVADIYRQRQLIVYGD